MIKKSVLFLVSILFLVPVFADTVEIDVPDVTLKVRNGFTVPEIEGFELDGTGEETVLPFKKMVFGSGIIKVEIVKKHEITLEAPLKKGEALYRLSDMRKVVTAPSEKRIMPTLSTFTFDRKPSFKRDRKIFSFDFYPLIPVADNKVVKIDRIRVTTKEKAFLPMANTKNGNSLLILTTNYFLAESEEIANFVKAKKESGFKVTIATERNYDGGELKGMERVEKIREYLRSVYKDYDYLLIIAGTNPRGNEVPMVVTRPDKADEAEYEPVPTDIFYAELTEEIDSNGNGVYGERTDRIDYEFELIVGRIPVYGKNVKNADKILARTVDFIRERPSTADYRLRVLFPSTISYYKDQDGQFGIPKMDGGYVAEYLVNNSLKEPFSWKRLVEKSGIDPSEFTEDDALTYDSMLENMNTGHGAVFWQGHGLSDLSSRTIWIADRNGNGRADTYSAYELMSETFVDNKLIEKVKSLNPFVFQGSCLNGTIESAGSLAYTVLSNTAVGVVGASQVSYGSIFSSYDLSSHDIFSYGAVFTDAVIKNEIPTKAFFEAKEKWSDRSVLLTVKLETNYLGDPSLNLNVKECETDSECDDSLFCDGKEVCVNGFCEKAENSLPCPDSGVECEESVCDEASKTCSTAPMPDGSFCGRPENACIGGRQCISGKCTDVDLKDCSELDSECSTGSCDPESGKCVRVAVNEGGSCSSGLICIKNEACREGFCEGEAPDLPEAGECRKTECSESEGFITVSDTAQNWSECTTEDGKEGFCDYGKCTPKKQQKKDSSSSGSGSGRAGVMSSKEATSRVVTRLPLALADFSSMKSDIRISSGALFSSAKRTRKVASSRSERRAMRESLSSPKMDWILALASSSLKRLP